MELQIGLIGAGAMGLYHAQSLRGSARVAGIFEPDEKRRAQALIACPYAKIFSAPQELIRSNDIDAVMICSPDSTHAPLALECLVAKKPALCEKPLAAAVDEAEKIVAAESAPDCAQTETPHRRASDSLAKKYISVGFNRRFDRAHDEVFNAVWSGELGRPLLWKGAHRNAAAFYNTQGAFILANSAGHDIDSARWLLQSEVRAVSVKGVRSREELPADARDCLLVRMEMQSGALACAEVYVNCEYGYEVIAEVVCRRGTAHTTSGALSVRRSAGRRGTVMTDDFRAYFAQSYAHEVDAWIQSVVDQTPFCGADAWDGYAAVAVAAACGTSLAQDKEIAVQMIEKPALYDKS